MQNKINNQKLSLETIISISAVFAVLLPLLLFTVVSLYSSSDTLTTVIKNELQAQSVLLSTSMDAFLEERLVDVKTISQADVLESQGIKKKIQYLNEVVDENKWLNDIDIIDADGKIIASSGVQNEAGKILWEVYPETKGLYLSALKAKQGEVLVSEAITLDDGPGILFITPITDDANVKVLGILAIEVNLKNIANILARYKEGDKGQRSTYVVDNSGKVIATNKKLVKFFSLFADLEVQPKLLDAFSLQGDIGNIIYTDADDVPVMAAYADMSEFGKNDALDWSVIIVEPLSEITAPIGKLKYILIALSIIIAIIAVVIAYYLSHNYSKNLEKIAQRAQDISNGIYSKELAIETTRKGSFHTMSSSFYQMEINLKKLIDELKDREQRLDITLDSIGDGVIATDEKGNITRMNPTSEKMTGWSFEDAEGKSITTVFSIIDETSREEILNPIDKVIATGETVFLSNHTVLLSKDGSQHHIEDSAAPIRDENDTIHGMILIFSDVTRRKNAETQYRRALKMDALGKLTGGIAHDYNNILGVIIGYCDLLEEDLAGQEDLISYVQTIQKSANRGAHLTKKLLDFSRHKKAETVKLDLNNLLKTQELMLEKTLTVRIELVLSLAEELWSVYLNESDTIDVLLNISINAMHAIDEYGKLTIHTKNVRVSEADALHLGVAAADYVMLSITDTGCGMDTATKEKIFDPFFSTKGEQGTGLGLSQVYGFIQRSKGTIKVYSEKGEGTQFSLYFPRYHEMSQENKALKDDSSSLKDFLKQEHKEKILVVDDEDDLKNLCTQVLKNNGFTTFSASSAKEALEILEKEDIDILMSDIIMPNMSGYELARAVSVKYPKIKIQLASGFSDERIISEEDKSFQENILYKPYTSQELLYRMSYLIKS